MRRSAALLLVLVALSGCRSAPTMVQTGPIADDADPASLRRPAAGALVGAEVRPGVYGWVGIPYAQPPVGALRWRAPLPAEPWEGTRRALALGPPCVQALPRVWTGADEVQVQGSEDCLTLQVYAPREVSADGARRPVMVWIHGGGNTVGAGSIYDPSLLVAEHGVVAVTLNYRLGPFGWFRHPALRAGPASPLDASGNFGTLDLVRALEWVRENIAAFGGDPGNVAIFGQSAGGLDVLTLLLAPQARGLFHRAISQSGGTWTSTRAEAENWSDAAEPGKKYSSREMLAQLLVTDGRAAGRDAARALLAGWSDAQQAEYLRGVPAEDLLRSYGDDASFETMPLVVRDGAVLPAETMASAFERGAYHRVPVILGTNRDESRLFMMLDPERVRRWFGFYLRARDMDRYLRDAEYGSDLWKADGADELAIAMRRVQGPSVWVYRFDWDEEPRPLGMDFPRLVGAAHGIEAPFVFGIFDLALFDRLIVSRANEPGRLALSRQMRSYWARFAWAGDPGRGHDGSLVTWQPWEDATPESPRFLVLDTPADGGLRMSADYVTTERVVARLERDPRFTAAERCEQLAQLAERTPRLVASGPRGCPAAVAAGR